MLILLVLLGAWALLIAYMVIIAKDDSPGLVLAGGVIYGAAGVIVLAIVFVLYVATRKKPALSAIILSLLAGSTLLLAILGTITFTQEQLTRERTRAMQTIFEDSCSIETVVWQSSQTTISYNDGTPPVVKEGYVEHANVKSFTEGAELRCNTGIQYFIYDRLDTVRRPQLDY